mgnify:CR=1 FL=1
MRSPTAAMVSPVLEEVLCHTHLPVMIQPNAGLPRLEDGETVYDVAPEEFARRSCQTAASAAASQSFAHRAFFIAGRPVGFMRSPTVAMVRPTPCSPKSWTPGPPPGRT